MTKTETIREREAAQARRRYRIEQYLFGKRQGYSSNWKLYWRTAALASSAVLRGME